MAGSKMSTRAVMKLSFEVTRDPNRHGTAPGPWSWTTHHQRRMDLQKRIWPSHLVTRCGTPRTCQANLKMILPLWAQACLLSTVRFGGTSCQAHQSECAVQIAQISHHWHRLSWSLGVLLAAGLAVLLYPPKEHRQAAWVVEPPPARKLDRMRWVL